MSLVNEYRFTFELHVYCAEWSCVKSSDSLTTPLELASASGHWSPVLTPDPEGRAQERIQGQSLRVTVDVGPEFQFSAKLHPIARLLYFVQGSKSRPIASSSTRSGNPSPGLLVHRPIPLKETRCYPNNSRPKPKSARLPALST